MTHLIWSSWKRTAVRPTVKIRRKITEETNTRIRTRASVQTRMEDVRLREFPRLFSFRNLPLIQRRRRRK